MKKKVLYLAGFVGGLIATAAGVILTASSVKKIATKEEATEDFDDDEVIDETF